MCTTSCAGECFGDGDRSDCLPARNDADRDPGAALVRRGTGPRDRRIEVAGRRRLGQGGDDTGALRDHAGDDREHGVHASLRRSEVSRVPRGGNGERARRGRVPPCERRARRRGRDPRGQLLRAQRPDRGGRRLAGPRHRGDPRALDRGDAGLGSRVGPARVRADGREAVDLHEPALLAREHGQHTVVRRSRLSAVDRPLGRVGAERAGGQLGRGRLEVLAMDLHRARRRDRRERRPGPVRRLEPRSRQDRLAGGRPADRRRDRRPADPLRRGLQHVRSTREPGHRRRARRHVGSGCNAAPVDRQLQRGRRVLHLRRSDARDEGAVGGVRLPGPRRARGGPATGPSRRHHPASTVARPARPRSPRGPW